MKLKEGLPDLYDSSPPPWLAWSFIAVTILAIVAILWFIGCRDGRAANATDFDRAVRGAEEAALPALRDCAPESVQKFLEATSLARAAHRAEVASAIAEGATP